MREWCSCGAAFHALSHRRVREWRTNHHHDSKADPEPDKQGATSQVEMRWQPPHEPSMPVVTARIGFTPNA